MVPLGSLTVLPVEGARDPRNAARARVPLALNIISMPPSDVVKLYDVVVLILQAAGKHVRIFLVTK